MPEQNPAIGVVRFYAENRWLAHSHLFAHRHPDSSPQAHRDLVESIYQPGPRQLIEGFRGFAKSTYLEEAAVLRGCLREYRNMLIVGSSYSRACDRLAAVKREFEINDFIIRLFGLQHGPVWQEGKIVLANGACVQALGRDQSMLGIKHYDWRPDAALVDDIEDPEEVRTDAEREQTWSWFLKTFLPSLDHPLTSWVRVLGTRRGGGSLPERLEKSGWPTARFPIEIIGDEGERVATWPAKFPLDEIDSMRKVYSGDMHTWAQEYMCQASSEADRVFTRDMIRVEPRVRSWQAVYAMYDPARTVRQQSASTGKAVWSWFGSRLVFWEIEAESWLPDRIIADLFETHRRYSPTWVGFEEDGLNEWALQPIRAEMAKRREALPLLPVRAPRGKSQFIAGLQPYMRAGEVTFAGDAARFEEAIAQFLSFPRGRIDAPNAAAYALLLRPGAPVYESFSEEHVAEGMEPLPGSSLYLAANADGVAVTAALVQRIAGEFRVLADWVREGSPSDVVGDLADEAALTAENREPREETVYGEGGDLYKLPLRRTFMASVPPRWVVPGWHRDSYRNVGLVQAVRSIPQAVSAASGSAEQGRVRLADMLAQRPHGRPAVLVSPAARWTLRAMSGGYARSLGPRGMPQAEPDKGLYALLMEGIESFIAISTLTESRPDEQPIAINRAGMPYRSAMPERARR